MTARRTFTAHQQRELLDLGVYPEQVRRLERDALERIHWRQAPSPRMQDVRERLDELAKALNRVEKLYVRISTSKMAASQEANARLQSAADDLLLDADKLGDSLETASAIVNRTLELFSPKRRSTRRDTAHFVRLIMKALELGQTSPIQVGRKRRPFCEIVRIVSEASGGWSADDAIRAYLRTRVRK